MLHRLPRIAEQNILFLSGLKVFLQLTSTRIEPFNKIEFLLNYCQRSVFFINN
jgi:hypothetical protein